MAVYKLKLLYNCFELRYFIQKVDQSLKIIFNFKKKSINNTKMSGFIWSVLPSTCIYYLFEPLAALLLRDGDGGVLALHQLDVPAHLVHSAYSA